MKPVRFTLAFSTCYTVNTEFELVFLNINKWTWMPPIYFKLGALTFSVVNLDMQSFYMKHICTYLKRKFMNHKISSSSSSCLEKINCAKIHQVLQLKSSVAKGSNFDWSELRRTKGRPIYVLRALIHWLIHNYVFPFHNSDLWISLKLLILDIPSSLSEDKYFWNVSKTAFPKF